MTKKQQGFAHIAGIIAIVLILAGVGVYYYSTQSQNSDVELNNQGQQNNEQTVDTENNKEDQTSTSNWKKYQSEKYDFEIIHPSSWEKSSYVIGVDPVFKLSGPEGEIFILPRGSEVPVPTPRLGTSINGTKFVTEDGKVFAYKLSFSNTPSSWVSWGYVYGKASMENLEQLEPVNATIPINADVNETDVVLVQKILDTFHFTN